MSALSLLVTLSEQGAFQAPEPQHDRIHRRRDELLNALGDDELTWPQWRTRMGRASYGEITWLLSSGRVLRIGAVKHFRYRRAR